ncbi:MAG: sulfite exporter TauE/SafE family protein [Sphingomonadaceae bacterium]|nr:sulfite exporter TauE/SafE family protein [Sphingomonadaceae bacterium]
MFDALGVDPAAAQTMLWDILPFVAVGFAAQMVDGALGMAFGVIANTMLLALGVPPAVASGQVHVIKVFTGGMSGASHALHKNVDWKLFTRLTISGVIGGVLGAYVLTQIDAEVAKPFVLGYLTLIGLFLLWRAWDHVHIERHATIIEPLGVVGGFLDAGGGGGWGPVVTSNLLIQGHNPRMTVGTVNTSEFIIAIAISITFLVSLGWEDFSAAVIGLLVGGVLAAPLGAWLTKRIPARPLMLLVGVVLTVTSLFGIAKALALI